MMKILFNASLLIALTIGMISTATAQTQPTNKKAKKATRIEQAPPKIEKEVEKKVAVDSEEQKEFGTGIDADAELTDFMDMISEMEEADSSYFVTRASVRSVCKKKGCFMKLSVDEMEGGPIMVRFKDYGFFVPKDLTGEVMIQGMAYRETTPVERLKHYAEDAGKSQEEIDAITEPKEEIIFIAEGVRIL